jgi:hypothetical protein
VNTYEKIKSKIDAAHIIIADISKLNPYLFATLGYAWGRGKHTILISKVMEVVDFTVHNQRHLKYDRIRDLEDILRKELLLRLG